MLKAQMGNTTRAMGHNPDHWLQNGIRLTAVNAKTPPKLKFLGWTWQSYKRLDQELGHAPQAMEVAPGITQQLILYPLTGDWGCCSKGATQ